MNAKLVSYEYVPLGFEMAIKNTEGRIWNLWYNIQLTDDPERWDSEVKLINNMQSKLGELSMGHRLMRAQMAEFCRVHPLFPKSIIILCEEIGDERFFKPVKIGCEGRDLLDSLGYHDSKALKRQQEGVMESYVESLKNWLENNHPESSTDFKVCGFLGTLTEKKRSWVENLIHLISQNELSGLPFQQLVEEVCTRKEEDFLVRARMNYLGRPFNCFKCEEGERCGCLFSMFIDSGLLCVGTFGEERSMLEEFGHFIQENILIHAVAINSWLEGVSPRDIKTLPTTSYINKSKAQDVVKKVHSALGKMNEIKRWLAACLLKTVKSNKRWHNTTELIDDFPEATSWLHANCARTVLC